MSAEPSAAAPNAAAPNAAASVDPITLEVIRNRLDVIAEQMEVVLLKAAHSAIVKEALDATAAIFDARGRTMAQAAAIPAHLGMLVASVRRIVADFEREPPVPGDVYIVNDPYDGGTHLPDVTILAPVFYEGRVVALSATMAHHQDIGGKSPGSTPPDAGEIFAEGLRIPLLKLYVAGAVNDTFMVLLRANVRLPEMFEGDLGAQLAACNTGGRLLGELFAELGRPTVEAAIDQLLDYAERLTRLEIEKIPDGEYAFVDYLDDDGMGSDPIEIAVTVTIRGSDLHVDFSGSHPQVRGGLNCVVSSTMCAVYYVVRAITDASIPNNEGCYRPITAHLPSGTIVNARPPAPVGARTITFKRIADVLFGALAPAIPEKVIAASSGQANIMYVGGVDPASGEPYVGYIAVPWAGGMGARSGQDGLDVVETDLTNSLNYPTEAAEDDLPMRLRWVRLWPDSGGAGRSRGGLGYAAEVEWLRGEGTVSVRRDRHRTGPWGLFGGQAAPPCRTVLAHPDGSQEEIPSKTVLTIRAGDLMRIWTSGGGGYGDPLERPVELVLDDVLDGRVTATGAARDYGVVVADGRLDRPATEALRARRRAERGPGPLPIVDRGVVGVEQAAG
jgi:N-methylhydantoinase B